MPRSPVTPGRCIALGRAAALCALVPCGALAVHAAPPPVDPIETQAGPSPSGGERTWGTLRGHTAAPFAEIVADGTPPESPHIKAAGDLNGDGLLDLFVASAEVGGAVAWYEAPAWVRHPIPIPLGGWSTDAELFDIDLDGDVDVLISQWYVASWIGWLENPGAGAANWALHIIGPPRAHDISVADLDGDGDNDFATRDQAGDGAVITIWRQGPPLNWQVRAIPCSAGEGLHLVDLSGDGRPDAVIGGTWYETPPGDIVAGQWIEHAFAPGWTHPDARVASGDLDGDGLVDLALAPAEGTYRLSWFERTGGPTWVEHIVIAEIDGAHSLEIGDVDCDGALDLVTATMHQYTDPDFVGVYYNEAHGTSWSAQILSEAGSHNLGMIDLDADDDLDLFGANWGGVDRALTVWENGSTCGTDCPADVDGDGQIGFGDLTPILITWGNCDLGIECIYDITGDGNVGFADLILLLMTWGDCG